MWTQTQIDEIGAALWHLPADKLLEAKRLVLELKERYGYPTPVECSDAWTREDELDVARTARARRLERERYEPRP